MSNKFKGRAEVDPDNPRAFGMCDRCKFQYNLYMLTWQYRYAGPKLLRKNILVCPTCLDDIAQFERTIILPVDPPSLYNARPENYAIDEADLIYSFDGQIVNSTDNQNLIVYNTSATATPIDETVLTLDGQTVLTIDGMEAII